MPGEDFDQKAASDIDSYIATDTHRVLYEGDRPVAMTGFNATLPEAVQIGAVYTPPADRSRGLARRAVAMHLQEALAGGVTDAILFAASPQACKAYEAVGFARKGDYAILVYEEPQVIYG
jgi:predicted GNAT family acetyltransferase